MQSKYSRHLLITAASLIISGRVPTIIKSFNLEDINYEIFYSNANIPYFVNELSGYELTAANIKRVINMLEE